MNKLFETASPRPSQAFCPNLGTICVNRAAVVRLYTEPVDSRVADSLPSEARPAHDGGKLDAILQNYCGNICTAAALQPITTE